MHVPVCFSLFFFFNDTATTEIYTLSLHDALPISQASRVPGCCSRSCSARATTRADRKSTRLNSSHGYISYAVFCLKKSNNSIVSSYADATGHDQGSEGCPLSAS